jgi:hypothetical protein
MALQKIKIQETVDLRHKTNDNYIISNALVRHVCL